MSEFAYSASDRCRNCGQPLTGAYCAACGQSADEGHAPTIGHFIHELVHEFTHLDGTIFRTLKALFFHPGRLTEEYWAGRVVSWIRPLRLFLIVAALHLLASTGVGPMNFQVVITKSPKGQVHFGINRSGRLEDVAGIPSGSVLVSREEHKEFTENFEKAYHEIRYSSVLLFAVGAWLFYRRRQPYFAASLILALHFYTFWYVLAIIGGILSKGQGVFRDLPLLACVYLFLVLGRLFHEHWYWRLGKTLALWVYLIAIELALGLAAGAWAAHLASG